MEYRQTLIKIENLNYAVDGKQILKNVNVEVKDITGRGQIIAILGPSGVGKTTLFRILAGLQPATSGSVDVLYSGKTVMEPIHPHEMGVVQQSYPLFEHRTILGNLLVANKNKQECLDMLKRFSMSEYADMYPCRLSGGQRQRIAIIQQVLCSDRYVLMDEPFSGLDVMAKCDVCKVIKEVASLHEENTILVITHGIEDALKVADTIWMVGRDRDVEGNIIPGAYIKHNINLIDRGFNMNCCMNGSKEYFDILKEINQKFVQL